ncbi:hypothetical protein BV210_02405 [Halorientalis sp. IM1011]|uniref:hypothetical protein n=1 Tax=Halorientalis sp. IM1011 TaxID=1932360 RepID=UPI00097CD460|nr:hypothetical protein [Halorientalis sp. IM1011]AQL41636.1 hypothetical protein BV210_02405 [Halorientalis sp. IM1011]
MTRNMVTTTVSVDPADALFLDWATGINASGLFREALSEQMDYRDIDRDELVALVEEALRDDDIELTDLYEQTSCVDDLETVLATTQQTFNSINE